MEDPAFAARLKQAAEPWDVAGNSLPSASRPVSRKRNAPARSKPLITRSAGSNLPATKATRSACLRRVAKALLALVRVVLEPDSAGKADARAEDPVPNRGKRTNAKPA